MILPVLPLSDAVLLPGTVATLTIDTEDAPREPSPTPRPATARVVVVPEVDGRLPRVGVIAHVEQAGQLPTGIDAAILRAVERATLGAEVVAERSGRWLDVEPVAEVRPSPRVERSAAGAAGRPRRDRRPAPLPATARDPAHHRRGRRPDRRGDRVVRGLGRAPAHRARGDGRRHPGRARPRLGQGPPGRADRSTSRSARTSPRGSRSSSASTCCASSWRPSARSSATAMATPRATTAPRPPSCRCPSRSARPSRRRSIGSSARATRAPSRAGSGPGSIGCSGSPGARPRPTTSTWWPRARCSTPTTTA